MGKRLTQLTRVTEVDKEDYLLVDGQNFLESKKVALKDINLNKFNTESFYNKSQTDESFVKRDGDKVLSTNDFTQEDKEKLDNSQEQLISGVNLKTINGQSLLGKGDIRVEGGSGGGGTTNYEELSDKPKINGVELSGNKTTQDLGIKIPTKLSELENDSGYITPTAIGEHNTSEQSHNDIRLEIQNIAKRLNTFFDTDDTTLDELSEIIEYITNNKTLIESVTTSKVSVLDIVNDLTTNVVNKPLSAAQGVVLKKLVDNLTSNLNNYALKTDIPKKVSQLENDKGYLTEHQDISGKLDASKLPEAINDALEQAKASGEFDGKDGVDGKDGSNGKDGVSATHSWNGTTLTVTSASGTSSADLKGEKGDRGEQGIQGERGLQGEQGVQGEKGEKGDTGATGSKGADGKDGQDYIITAADKQEIKNEILSSIITQEAGESESLVMSQKAVTDLVAEAVGSGGGGGTTEYETVDSIEEMTDTSKQYVLSTDGYIYAYTKKTETVYHEAENKFVASEAEINKRMGSSSLSVQNGYVWSGAIAVDLTKETPFRVKVEGTKITETGGTNANAYQKLWLCADTGTSKLSAAVLLKGENSSNYAPLDADGIIHADYKDGAKLSDSIITGTKYIRIGFKFSDSAIASTSALSGVKITIPCEAYTEEVTTTTWVSTGMKPEAGGGGNYVELLVKVNKNTTDIAEVSKRVTNIETGSESVTIPTFWQSAVDACIAKIKALQVGRNCVTFPFFSDNHQNTRYAGMLIAHIMKECNIPYCFFGGDSIDSGYIASEAVMIEQDKKFDTMMSYVPNGRFCRAVGNHDGFWNDGTNKYWYNRSQVYDLFLREESIAQNKHFGGEGTYYYIDDIASKVRWIVMDTNNAPVDVEQIAWVQNTALNITESGWGVVFISHQPISNHYHAGITNAADVVSAVVSTANTKNIPIIGWYSGHVHRDIIATKLLKGGNGSNAGTEVSDLGFTQVIITSDHTGIAYDDSTKHTIANDDQSHAIDFVTINKSTRTVNITRLGIGSDRSYTY